MSWAPSSRYKHHQKVLLPALVTTAAAALWCSRSPCPCANVKLLMWNLRKSYMEEEECQDRTLILWTSTSL
ncbi:hypothetical protein PVAP13_5KG396600 [Panicum virgatum]|uniref:Secreted protein n=1 Tax=Panicum virgatum TaxID=38727 RepID=A0A8T0SRK1_PANVG|nr:hypothetical protein PVAP13_5KG396600 [Panicum virgatum]